MFVDGLYQPVCRGGGMRVLSVTIRFSLVVCSLSFSLSPPLPAPLPLSSLSLSLSLSLSVVCVFVCIVYWNYVSASRCAPRASVEAMKCAIRMCLCPATRIESAHS